jgi:hypothetical protein
MALGRGSAGVTGPELNFTTNSSSKKKNEYRAYLDIQRELIDNPSSPKN